MHVHTELRGPVFAVREEKIGNANAGFVKTSAGALLVDALRSPDEGSALLDLALAEAGAVRALIYTHEHGDHHLGSTGYPAMGVLASEGTARGIESFVARNGAAMEKEGLGPLLPGLVFEHKLRLPGDPEVVVVELGGHARGSSVVHVPSEGLLFAGDLLFLGPMPWGADRVPWLGDGWPDRWAASLRTLEAWDPQTVIPGHGPIAGKDALARQRQWLEEFSGRMEDLRRQGVTAPRALRLLAEEFKTPVEAPFGPVLQEALTERFGFPA